MLYLTISVTQYFQVPMVLLVTIWAILSMGHIQHPPWKAASHMLMSNLQEKDTVAKLADELYFSRNPQQAVQQLEIEHVQMFLVPLNTNTSMMSKALA